MKATRIKGILNTRISGELYAKSMKLSIMINSMITKLDTRLYPVDGYQELKLLLVYVETIESHVFFERLLLELFHVRHRSDRHCTEIRVVYLHYLHQNRASLRTIYREQSTFILRCALDALVNFDPLLCRIMVFKSAAVEYVCNLEVFDIAPEHIGKLTKYFSWCHLMIIEGLIKGDGWLVELVFLEVYWCFMTSKGCHPVVEWTYHILAEFVTGNGVALELLHQLIAVDCVDILGLINDLGQTLNFSSDVWSTHVTRVLLNYLL